MAENENNPKPRPAWEQAIRVIAFVAGIACLIVPAAAFLGWNRPGVPDEIFVTEVREGDWTGYAALAAIVAAIAVPWLIARRKRR